ncbi:MAG: thioredoxin domain-containing protein [Deltaproteobacteria bacterium]|nr:thioredoxin domain-containing protein [Deltaproteobacteria bacterium]
MATQEARRGLDRRGLYARRITGGASRTTREERPAAPPRDPEPDLRFRVPVGAQPSRGPADALVTIVEFSDFQCPFCARVVPTLEAVRERYGDDVRIVWRNTPLPFHPNARPAAVAALEAYEQAGNQGFWALHDALFANQRELENANLESLFVQQGLNLNKLRRAVERGTHDAVIDADLALGARVGVLGTPIFFINGRPLRGSQPLETFVTAIDAALLEARGEIQRGTPRAAVYEALTRDGLTQAPARPAPSARRPAPDPDRVYDIAIPSDAPSRGGADAPVVIQEFADFQCPFCARVEPTLARIREVYGERVRFVWRNYPLPFHDNAMPAALAAMEVYRQGGNAKFWAYHDLLFAHSNDLTEDNLVQWARELGGIRSRRVRRAIHDSQGRAQIGAEMDPMRAAGAHIGTPAFLINGRLLQGAQPFEAFQRAIDRGLQEATAR